MNERTNISVPEITRSRSFLGNYVTTAACLGLIAGIVIRGLAGFEDVEKNQPVTMIPHKDLNDDGIGPDYIIYDGNYRPYYFLRDSDGNYTISLDRKDIPR